MFGQEYLTRNIDIIFDIEINCFTTDYSFRYIEDKSGQEDLMRKGGTRINFNLSTGDNYSLQWDAYSTLKQLYSKIEKSSSDRETFLQIIKEKLLTCEEITKFDGDHFRNHNAASLAFYFLLKIGKQDEIISLLKTMQERSSVHPTGLFEDIFLFIYIEPEIFNESLLDALGDLNDKLPSSHDSVNKGVKDNITTFKYFKLKQSLIEVNEELNIDKERAIDIIEKYSFPQNMVTFLLEIDKISPFAEWQTVSSGMIGNIRFFFETLIKNLAAGIKNKTLEDYPADPNKGEMGNKRAYIKTHLKLSDKDDKLISSFVEILHKEGGHTFISEKKYFIMTKNIGIEIAYFLLSKYEEFLSESY